MRRKDSTVECEFHPHLAHLLFLIDDWYRTQEFGELVVTSGSEKRARHGNGSLHYAGCAVDTRTRNGPEVAQFNGITRVVTDFCIALGIPRNWVDVVLEANHIHTEYQPKRET